MNCAQAVCDALDELDRTPFGDMGKALDKISDLAVKSAQQAVKLEARIGGAEMSEAKHSDLPWQWHPESKDQAHTGAVFRMERPGHAYAIAMKPRYVFDDQWAGDAAFIVKACNTHDQLVAALEKAMPILDELEQTRLVCEAIDAINTALAGLKEG